MKRKNIVTSRGRLLGVAVVCCALAAGCGKDEGVLPGGGEPMVFIAGVEGADVSRATTTAEGSTSWEVDDGVAISKDGGVTVKEYKITNTNGKMSPATGTDAIPWEKRQETIAAWHPVGCVIGDGTGSTSITDQRTGHGDLEKMLHAPAKEYAYGSTNPVNMTFRHALAKVKVKLIPGEGISDTDLSGAAVALTGYTAGTLGYGGMTGTGEPGKIAPKRESNDTYTALVIPREMEDEPFIKVTTGTGGAAREYVYTPAGVRLEAGKQYSYAITVKKNGLAVTASGAGEWMGSSSEVTSREVLKNFTADDLKIGDYYYSDGTWSDGGLRKYSDGTTALLDVMPVLADASGKPRTVIGIVLKAGRDGDGSDWKDDCKYTLKGTKTPMTDIHGYVLGLHNASDERDNFVFQWGPFGTQVVHTDMNREQYTGFYGYKNTNAIKAFAAKKGWNLQTAFPATYAATEAYETSYPAPANSSGWFLPSAGQGQYWLNNGNVILASVRKATGNSGYKWKDTYLSSSEYEDNPEYEVWFVNFRYDEVSWTAKDDDDCYVRGVFAF